MENNFFQVSFENNSDVGYLLRLGQKAHLEEIQSGKIRFSKLRKYLNIENRNIGDTDEGLESILYPDNKTKISYSHPNFLNGKEIDITHSISLMKNYPSSSEYIFCCTYFKAVDIENHSIFDKKTLNESEWNHTLFICEPEDFIHNIFEAIKPNSAKAKKVSYLDYNITQLGLTAFTKSKEYQYQKEFRISVDLTNENNGNITRINDDVIEIKYKPVQSYIMPTKDFNSGWTKITNK